MTNEVFEAIALAKLAAIQRVVWIMLIVTALTLGFVLGPLLPRRR